MVSAELKARITAEQLSLSVDQGGEREAVRLRHIDEWKERRARHDRVREGLKRRNRRMGAKQIAEWRELKESQEAARAVLKESHAALRTKEKGK